VAADALRFAVRHDTQRTPPARRLGNAAARPELMRRTILRPGRPPVNTDRLGFRSLFVLDKIGHDLRAGLSDTLEAPVPERMAEALSRIGAVPDLNDGTLDLDPREYGARA
jgi:hypothetical protein